MSIKTKNKQKSKISGFGLIVLHEQYTGFHRNSLDINWHPDSFQYVVSCLSIISSENIFILSAKHENISEYMEILRKYDYTQKS